MKVMKLGDILAHIPDGEKVCEELLDVANSTKQPMDMAGDFKRILKPHSEALLKAGVVADYLAYFLAANIDNIRAAAGHIRHGNN